MSLYVFVEGPDDERLVNKIIGSKEVKIIKYANEKKAYINNYIKSIKGMPYADYALIGDIDLKSLKDKKDDLLLRFPDCEREKIIVSISEIESWYIAGVNEKKAKLLKIKKIDMTDKITKEIFDNIIPRKYKRIEFLLEILNDYDLQCAVERNHSLRYFVNYLMAKYKMAVL